MLFVDRLAEERREGYAEGYDSGFGNGYDSGFDSGYGSGFESGQQNTILGLYKDGTITAEIAADKLGISIEELEVLINEH